MFKISAAELVVIGLCGQVVMTTCQDPTLGLGQTWYHTPRYHLSRLPFHNLCSGRADRRVVITGTINLKWRENRVSSQKT
ncbi:hypothetical protein ACTXT7_010494 [Hymenolepis weldensis]